MQSMTDVQPITEITIRETVSALERIQISISPSSPPEKVREVVSRLASDCFDVGKADRALKFLIAKACLAVRQRKLYREYGYRSHEAYLKKEVYRPGGLTHGTVWKGIAAVRAFPFAPAERLALVHGTSLAMAAQVVKRGHKSPRQAARILAQAETMLPEIFAATHGREAVHSGFGVIRVVTSKSFKREFDNWAEGRDVVDELKQLVRRGAHRLQKVA